MKSFFEKYGSAVVCCSALIMMIGLISFGLKEMAKVNPKTERQKIETVNSSLLGEQKPTITVANQKIVIGTPFNAKGVVKASDVRDGDISNKVQNYGDVNINVKGRYLVRYVVENSLGLKQYKNIYVLVD